jgi:hypothetical protein
VDALGFQWMPVDLNLLKSALKRGILVLDGS